METFFIKVEILREMLKYANDDSDDARTVRLQIQEYLMLEGVPLECVQSGIQSDIYGTMYEFEHPILNKKMLLPKLLTEDDIIKIVNYIVENENKNSKRKM